MTFKIAVGAFLVLASLLGALSVTALWKLNQLQKREINSLIELNNQVLDSARNEAGQQIVKLPVAEVSKETMERLMAPELDQLRKDFKEPLKRIETYIKLKQTSRFSGKVEVRDTLVSVRGTRTEANGTRTEAKDSLTQADRDTIAMKVFRKLNAFMSFEALVGKDSAEINLELRNDTRVVIHKDKRETWWKFWKKRPTRAKIININPMTGVEESKIVKVISK